MKRRVVVLVKTLNPVYVAEEVAAFDDVDDEDFERLKELLRRVRID